MRLSTIVACIGCAGPLGAVSGQETPTEPPHLERPDESPLEQAPGLRTPSRVLHAGFAVQVNVDETGQNITGDAANEPSIAVDPIDPSRMAIGWRQFNNVNSNFRQAGYGYTTDGGASWTFPGVLEPGVFRSDPVLDADSDGNFYYYSLTSNFFTQVFKSTDGGVTWGAPAPAFGGDKNWMAVDRTGGIGDGNIYCTWQINGNPHSPDQFCRSIDRGASFQDLMEIPGNPIFGTIGIGPDGELYVAGINPFTFTSMIVARSSNARDPNQAPVFDLVTEVALGAVPFGGGPNPGGLLGQVWIAVDQTAGPSRGNVYLLGTVQRTQFDPLDIIFSRSTDGGATWSTPVRVNDDPQSANSWQWFGTMSVAPDGRIDVIWNDTRDTQQVYLSKLYYAYSEDQGVSWTANQPLSPPFNSHIGWPNQNKIGDYYDMVSDEAGGLLAWSATFNGEQDVYFSRILAQPPQNSVITPDSFAVAMGRLLDGGTAELAASDDSYLRVRQRAPATPLLPAIRVDVRSHAIFSEPSESIFTVEAAATALPAQVPQRLSMFDFTAGTFEVVDQRLATLGDSTAEATRTNDPGRFVQASTGQVYSRLEWFDPGNVVLPAWQARIDLVQWTMVP